MANENNNQRNNQVLPGKLPTFEEFKRMKMDIPAFLKQIDDDDDGMDDFREKDMKPSALKMFAPCVSKTQTKNKDEDKNHKLPQKKEAIKKMRIYFGIGNPMIEARRLEESLYEPEMPSDLKDSLVEISGTYDGKDDEYAYICNGKKVYTITDLEDVTTYSASYCEIAKENAINGGDALYIIAVKAGSIYFAVTVIKEEERDIFEQVESLYGKALAIRDFNREYRNKPDKREYIAEKTRGKKYERCNNSHNFHFAKQEQPLFYAVTKENRLPEQQAKIEAMFKDTNKLKHKTDQRLEEILQVSDVYSGRKPVNKEEFNIKWNQKFFKMEKVKQQIGDVLVSSERAKKRGVSMLFVGNPGVGKTECMEFLAEEIFNIPYANIPLNGMTCPLELDGTPPDYDSADAGGVFKAFLNNGTSEIVLALDEIDKMNRDSKEGDPMNSFLLLMQGKHVDKYIGCPVSTENTIIIATANSVDTIPEPIISRFDAVIYFDDYSNEDKLEIAKNYVLPEIMKNFDLSSDEIRFSDNAIRYIIENYCADAGVRDLKHNLNMIIRRSISSGFRGNGMITVEEIHEVLSEQVEETEGIYYNRHKEEYPKEMQKEIEKSLRETKVSSNSPADRFEEEKKKIKLKYLLACRNEKNAFGEAFEPQKLSNALKENLYGMEAVIKEITGLYHTRSLQGESVNSNLALWGNYGTGKTAVAESIANAMGYTLLKVPLNGMDDIRVLRGHSSTYAGSEPGIIMKGIKKAGSLKVLILLDEIDKAGSKVLLSLIDLLDREFTDDYLGVSVNLKDALFIATANDWGNVPAVIRDRFIVIQMDGYSRNEKAEIISNYTLPKIERGYATANLSVTMDETAIDTLLDTYCTSFGVRDAEKAVQKLVSSKLLAMAGNEYGAKIHITEEDLKEILGAEPVPRGNFPVGNQPGVAKALAVNALTGGSVFAIETVLLDGEEGVEITGLPQESATDSVKIAITCVKKQFPELLNGKRIHVHFGEGSVAKDGPSAGVALFMSIYSAAINKPLCIKDPFDVAYTGELSLTGGVFAVGGLYEKIQAASKSGCRKVYIPLQNYERLDLKRLQYPCEIVPVSYVTEIVYDIFPENR